MIDYIGKEDKGRKAPQREMNNVEIIRFLISYVVRG
jgi:hypothetical protein